MKLTTHAPDGEHWLGFIPGWLASSTLPAATVLDACYAHGGGWRPFNGFTLNADNSLTYPGDPALKSVATISRGNETICVYRHAWVAIIQHDRRFEVCRMD